MIATFTRLSFDVESFQENKFLVMGLPGGVPICGLRLRTGAAKRFEKVDTPRRPLGDVYQGAESVNGVPVHEVPEEKAA